MTTLLSIDPGAHTGIALFFIGPDCPPAIVNANVVAPDDVGWARVMADIVIIETPRIYPNQKARPADILTLARLVGRYQERFKAARVRLVEPHEWKGSINGDIMTARIESALTPAELAIVKGLPKATAHNAVDAIGMGKWAFRQAWMRGIL